MVSPPTKHQPHHEHECGVADNETNKVAFGWVLLAPNGVCPPPPPQYIAATDRWWGVPHTKTNTCSLRDCVGGSDMCLPP